MSKVFWSYLFGGLQARAAGIAAELGIADSLAGGARPVDELARETGADADTLNRYLRALASDGIFEQVEPGIYRNTEASELLRSGTSIGAFAQLFGGTWLDAASRLDATGRATYDDWWAWLAEHARERELFDLAMVEGTERRVDRLDSFAWGESETVVDVGGGNGSFLLELFARQPGLQGIVFDLPETVRDEDALAAAGIEFVEGSFFESVPPASTYVLGTILHDWDDDCAAAILRTIGNHAPAGARVLVLDAVVQPANEPQGSKWLDLLMMTIGGRERTEPEWRALVDAAGLEIESIQDGLVVCRSR